ncbi:hypothetical protein [Planomonospora sp. ID67723]|uniref:hypothetical protein n=1 Tax=Planomonospora sp. ID67723 TaxID=2738134 RepID=UPI0018C3C7BD|nr:hypothetical protein [Planomonospora sp. ID67723]
MMERLTACDRPFSGRADNMVLAPLNPAETAQALGLGGADAVDAPLFGIPDSSLMAEFPSPGQALRTTGEPQWSGHTTWPEQRALEKAGFEREGVLRRAPVARRRQATTR